MGFHSATDEDILNGLTSDIYFYRTKEILQKQKIRKRVKAEFCAKNLDLPWAVFLGLEEIKYLLKNLPVKATGLSEGTFFKTLEPVLTIEGNYADFGVYETALLGLMCQASGVATKAARLRKYAQHKTLLSFGARRMHPALAPMIERSAYLGGCDGVSVVKSAELLGLSASGTMPHALILVVGEEEKAFKIFHKVISKDVQRIALIDTFTDEKLGALKAAQALGKNLYGIRLDTPSSRKGDFVAIIKEVRWELSLRGFKEVKIFVSGGLDEKDVIILSPYVDGFGIGTALSNAPVINFSMDIVEVNGKPLAKRGKLSGEKKVARCQTCFHSEILPVQEKNPKCPDGHAQLKTLTEPLSQKTEPISKIRDYVLKQLPHFSL